MIASFGEKGKGKVNGNKILNMPRYPEETVSGRNTMRTVFRDKNYFVFRDSDGVLGFSIKAFDGRQINPRFLYDGEGRGFLIRRAKQVILLDRLAAEFSSVLEKTPRVRFLETPEDSSQIIRQYEVPVVRIESVSLLRDHVVSEEEPLLPHSA